MSTRFPLTETAIVGVTLLAITLGGSVDLWAQTIVAGIAGMIILIAPPRGPLPRTPLLFAGALLLLGLAAYLPASSLGSTPWLHYLAFDAYIPQLPTRTQQPWLTMQAVSLLAVGLIWALYLFSLPWDKESRVRTAMGLVLGVAVLASVAAVAFIINLHIPLWKQEQNRGWFPNRNQTADVLAIVGLVDYALISDRLRRGKVSGYVLLAALVPIVTELVISYSRAGILLFFGGLLAWHLWPRPVRDRDNSLKTAVLSAALGFVLLAVFLAWGGETLMRFESGDAQTAADFSDFRGAIQLDALGLSLQAPFLGVGLGNFEPIFAFSQIDSINGNRAIHPESDWLWLACEMGWFAPIILIMGIVWWTRRCFPIEQKAGETLRRVFILATFVFLVHGVFDVGGHRTGSLWVGLLLAGLALPFDRSAPPSRWTPLLFRALGLALLLIAGWWFCSLRGLGGPPTTATLARLKSRLDATDATPAQLETTARAALKIAPLDWNLYFRLGAVEAVQPGETDRAVADFETARSLDPFWIEIPMDEGRVWDSANQPNLRLDTWKDGLRRLGPEAHEAFRQMVADAPAHSIEREGLAELAFDRLDYLLLLLPTSTTGEADALLTNLLQKDPQLDTLSGEQRNQLFAAWWTQGDQVRMMELINQHPEWAGDTWQYQAKFAGKEMDFQHACEIAAKWSHAPAVPSVTSDLPISALKDDLKTNPDTLTAGLVLYYAQMKQGQTDDALATLDTVDATSDHPAYIDYLEAQLYQQKQDWPNAWKAWLRFIGT